MRRVQNESIRPRMDHRRSAVAHTRRRLRMVTIHQIRRLLLVGAIGERPLDPNALAKRSKRDRSTSIESSTTGHPPPNQWLPAPRSECGLLWPESSRSRANHEMMKPKLRASVDRSPHSAMDESMTRHLFGRTTGRLLPRRLPSYHQPVAVSPVRYLAARRSASPRH